MRHRLLPTLLTALCSLPTMAAVVTSNACHAGTNRIFSVTTDDTPVCRLTGAGNINGKNKGDAGFIALGWAFVDSSGNTEGAHNGWLGSTGSLTSGLSGYFSINPAAWTTYDRVAIGFKSGEGGADPDWAIFELADHTVGGQWAITVATQELSHAILYGWGTALLRQPEVLPPPSNAQVSEPPVWLLSGLALGGLAWRTRRAKSARCDG